MTDRNKSTWVPSGTVADQAAHWVVLQEQEELTDELQEQFSNWASSPPNARALAEATKHYSVASELKRCLRGQELLKEALAAENRENAENLVSLPRSDRRMSGLRPKVLGRVAASLMVAGLIGGGVYTHLAEREPAAPHIAQSDDAANYDVYITAVGERRTVRLPDGSEMVLNTDTHVRVEFADKQRVVRLERGQGYFHVQPESARPFIVRAGDRAVQAVGTAFDVRLEGQRLQVVIEAGRVTVERETVVPGAVDRWTREGDLVPGQMLVADLAGSADVVIADVQRHMRWLSGFIEFDNEPLGDAIQEFNRYIPETVAISDQKVSELRLSGMFRAGGLDEFIGAVEKMYPVRMARAGGGNMELIWRGETAPQTD